MRRRDSARCWTLLAGRNRARLCRTCCRCAHCWRCLCAPRHRSVRLWRPAAASARAKARVAILRRQLFGFLVVHARLAALARRQAGPVGHPLLDARPLRQRQLGQACRQLDPLPLAARFHARPLMLEWLQHRLLCRFQFAPALAPLGHPGHGLGCAGRLGLRGPRRRQRHQHGDGTRSRYDRPSTAASGRWWVGAGHHGEHLAHSPGVFRNSAKPTSL